MVLPANLVDAQRRVAEHELDILFYTDIGMDPFTYFLAFARLAPVQCVTWGHPVTTGLETIDHFLSCDGAEIPESQNHYTENLVRLATFSTYYYRPESVGEGSRDEFGLPADRGLYLCPQSLFKLHPDMDEAFSRILAADPRAKIVFIDLGNDVAKRIIRQRFARTIPGHDTRFMFIPRMSQEKFARLLAVADVIIDSFPFSGGNTSLEAFASGLPVVTFPTPFLRGRLTAAMYRQMEISDLVADSAAQFADIAVTLGTDLKWREFMTRQIADQCRVLFENRATIEEFARFFTAAVSPDMPETRRTPV